MVVMNLAQRDHNSIWHPYTQRKAQNNPAELPIPIVSGKGVYLFDEQGNRYIDAISSWWVNIHGHAHPYIAEKVSAQLHTLEHVIFAGFTHQPAVELAERLLEILPSGQSKVFYSDNGSTAVEVALKMAIQYWANNGTQKQKIIAFENAYHGDTFGAMSVSARSGFTKPFAHLLFEVIHIPVPVKGKEEAAFTKLRAEILNHKDKIAAFIFEPLVLGAGGMLMYDNIALDQLISICKKNQILTIADEVMTGFGRTGTLFASDQLQQQPDIICLSKGLTGGTMPMGITTCTDQIFNAFISDETTKTLYHGHSYTANPIACTAALASLDLLLKEECTKNIQRISKHLRSMAENLRNTTSLTNIRCTGTILALDVVTNEHTSYFNSLRDRLYHFFLKRGIILRPLGNTLYIMPPYCINEDDLKEIEHNLKLMANDLVVSSSSLG
jgi:adenosylmethionine---8-amino-7-oxononanoate aminotransferase